MAKRKGVNYRNHRVKKRQERVQKIRKTAPFVGIGILIAGGVAIAIYGGLLSYGKITGIVASSNLFVVRNVKVRGNNRVSTAEILGDCGIATSSKVYNVNSTTVATNLCRNPWIEKVRCIKKWWGSVVIEIRERHPIALINDGDIALIDRSGAVIPLEKGRTYDLPLLCGVQVLVKKNGERYIDSIVISRICGFIDAVDSVDSSLFKIVTQFDVSDRHVARGFSAVPGTVVEIGYNADSSQVKNLRYLLDAFIARHEAPARINVQYRNLAFVKNNDHGGGVRVD